MKIQTSVLVLALLGTPLCSANGTRVTPIETRTSLSASHNPVAVGESFSMTATVTAASGTGPTGSVSFRSLPSRGGLDLGSDNLPMWQMGTVSLEGSGLSRSATITVRSAEPIIHFMTASYSGDGVNAKSQPQHVLQLNVYQRNTVVQPEVLTQVAPVEEMPLEESEDELDRVRMLRSRTVY